MATKTPPIPQPDSPLAVISLILGALSFTGPGLLFGIPAVILAIIALKRKVPGRNLSIIGLVLGSISTLLSVLAFALFLFLMVWAAQHDQPSPQTPPSREQPAFDSSQV